MTAIERTAYPRLRSRYTPKELDEEFTPTPADRIFVANATTDGDSFELHLLVQLKCFQYLGYFPALADIPEAILRHIRKTQGLIEEGRIEYSAKRTRARHRAAIRRYLEIAQYRQRGQQVASEAIWKAAQTMNNPADLINAAVEELIRQRIELPGFTTLDELVKRIRTEVNEGWYQQVESRLNERDTEILFALPTRRDEQSLTDFTTLKQPPGKPMLSEMKRIKNRLQWLVQVLDTNKLLADIPAARIAQFAAEARSLEAGDLARYSKARRCTLLACFLHQATIETRDHLIDIFLKRMRLIHQRAQEDLDVIREQQRSLTESLIRMLGDIAGKTEQIPDLAELGATVYEMMQGTEGAAEIRRACEALAVYDDNNILPLLQPHYEPYRRTIFEMLDLLEIRSTTQDNALIEALDFVKRHQMEKSKYLPADISLEFASQRWKKQIIHRQDGQVWYDQRKLEECVFSHVAAELRSGDLAVVGSEQYADIREQMLSWEECLPLLPDYCRRLGLPTSGKEFVRHLRRWLARTARGVDLTFPDNTQLSIDEEGHSTLKRIRARPVPAEAKALQSELRKRMPEHHLLDVLVLVHRLGEFVRHFGPLSGSDPKLADAAFTYLMTVFTYGTGIGPEEMARHSLGAISSRSISATNHQHVTAQKLDAGLVDIINIYARCDMPTFWGTGRSAAADGTLINLYENNLLSARHVRYGGYGGIAYYHIADNYIALFSHFISVGVWEAVYIIDGLLKNDSDIQPETLHADTQGQSLPVFGLTYLLGIQLMPRIRNWKDLTLFRPFRHTRYQHIDALFTDTIDWDLLEMHWQDMMQVIISIQEGKLLPSALLRKLGNHSPKNRLYRAFRELGRVVRTVFLLRFVSDEPLQRQVTTETNKVESYHNFRNWVSFGNGGEITTNDPIEMEKQIKYSDLLANALILQNVIDMTRVVHQLVQEGYPFNPELLRFISPYWTHHIRRFGDYVLRPDLPAEEIFFDIPSSDPPHAS